MPRFSSYDNDGEDGDDDCDDGDDDDCDDGDDFSRWFKPALFQASALLQSTLLCQLCDFVLTII